MAFEDWSFIISLKDINNFIKFKKEIKEEMENSGSPFNKLGLRLNWLGNVVYYQINCTEDELHHFNYIADNMIIYKMKPVIEYMTSLGWSEYLVPQINNFTDEEGRMSLSYGITLMFSPFKFRLYKLITWPIITIGLIAGLSKIITLLG